MLGRLRPAALRGFREHVNSSPGYLYSLFMWDLVTDVTILCTVDWEWVLSHRMQISRCNKATPFISLAHSWFLWTFAQQTNANSSNPDGCGEQMSHNDNINNTGWRVHHLCPCCLTKMEIDLYELSHQHSKIHLEPDAIQFFYEKGELSLSWYEVV